MRNVGDDAEAGVLQDARKNEDRLREGGGRQLLCSRLVYGFARFVVTERGLEKFRFLSDQRDCYFFFFFVRFLTWRRAVCSSEQT